MNLDTIKHKIIRCGRSDDNRSRFGFDLLLLVLLTIILCFMTDTFVLFLFLVHASWISQNDSRNVFVQDVHEF